jgi:hypothetical protein
MDNVTSIEPLRFNLLQVYFTEQFIYDPESLAGYRDLILVGLTHWITSTIVMNLNLSSDVKTSQTIKMIVAHYSFVQTLLDKSDDDLDLAVQLLRIKFSEFRGFDASDIRKFLGKLPHQYPKSYNDLIANLNSIDGNYALKNINFVTLTNILPRTWGGENATYFVFVALEHMPTLLSVFFHALTSRYKNSGLTKYLDTKKRELDLDGFIKKCDNILKGTILK